MERKEFEKSEIANINNSIEYSNDAIVSKPVLNREEGTVTLFAFDKGQSLSEHTTPFDAIVQVIDGKVKIIIDRKPYLIQKGELIIMPANIPHAVEAIEKFKMLLVMIKS